VSAAAAATGSVDAATCLALCGARSLRILCNTHTRQCWRRTPGNLADLLRGRVREQTTTTNDAPPTLRPAASAACDSQCDSFQFCEVQELTSIQIILPCRDCWSVLLHYNQHAFATGHCSALLHTSRRFVVVFHLKATRFGKLESNNNR
jgi:hypothetical protein